MIKPFEFIKVLVSSVCTVPNARNTRRSTALGGNPSYLVLCQIPRTFQPCCGFSLCWVWLWLAERKCALRVLSVTFWYTLLPAQFNSCFLFAEFSPNSFRGISGLGGIQVLKKGERLFFFLFFEVPKSSAAFSNNQNTQRETSSRTQSVDGRKVYGVYCTMLLSHEGEIVFGFVFH